jgi:hypothetical protein
MNTITSSPDFQNRLDIYGANDSNISKDLALILDTAKDSSLNDEAIESCREYANIKHKAELAKIIHLFEDQQKEIVQYHTILRSHFRTGIG